LVFSAAVTRAAVTRQQGLCPLWTLRAGRDTHVECTSAGCAGL